MKDTQNFAEKEICWMLRDEITSGKNIGGKNIGFEVEYKREDF